MAFRPRDSITRTEFAILMLRALGREKAAQAIADRPAFTDVGESYRWAWGYISLAAQDGLIRGYEGKFRPGDRVTQPEALTMLVRALGREPMVDADAPWPIGHVRVAQQLGIDTLTALIGSLSATRSKVAEYLATVLTVPLVELNARGDITSTGRSFLSLQDCTEARVKIHATSPPEVTPAWVECSGSALRPGDDDTSVRRIELSPGITLYGPDDIADLAGHSADVICGMDGRLIYAAPIATISGIISEVNLPQVTLSDGTIVDIGDISACRVDGLEMSFLGQFLLAPGLAVTFTFGPGDIDTLSCIDIYFPIPGVLEFRDGHYCLIITPVAPIAIWPGDPAGWIDENTTYTMNGIVVDEATLRSELSSQAHICIGTVVMDSVTGKASSLQTVVFDDMSTLYQPLVTRTPDGFAVPGTTPGNAVSHTLAPDAVITRGGSPATLGDLARGDLLSFRTNGSGCVNFVVAIPDTELPMVVWYPDETSTADRACISLSEALDPGTISVVVDGIPYSLTSVVAPTIDGNTFIPVYEPGNNIGDRTTLMIWPRLDFGDGLHTITVTGCDYAGNRMQQTLTSEYDTTPAKAQSITFSSDGATAKITFDDNMDETSVTSLNHWFCPERGENGALEARYDAPTRTLTLVMKSGFRAVTIVSEKLEDAAGNTVDVTFTTPK